MKNDWITLVIFVLLFSASAHALAMGFDTAVVGRVQGDSLNELEKSLNINITTVNGADYYTNSILNQNSEEGKTSDALEKVY